MDLYIVSEEREKAMRLINHYKFMRGFEHIKIEPIIFSSLELLKNEKSEREFLSLVREGIVLWEERTDEAGIQGVSE